MWENATMRITAKIMLAAATLLCCAAAPYTLLYTFTNGPGGETPSSPLVQGPSSLVYGTTSAGGATGQGTVYSLDLATGVQTPLYAFTEAAGADALTLGPDGILYGALQFGPEYGAIFSLDPATAAYSVLYAFKQSRIETDGFAPSAVAVTRDGTVYGQTRFGGAGSRGTVFELTKKGSLRVLLAFSNAGGAVPGPITLIGDALYGVICDKSGGTGSLYKIPTATGQPQALLQFTGGAGGGCPVGAVVPAGHGVVDGIASTGGSHGLGLIYQMNEVTGAETVLFNFPAKLQSPPNAILAPRGAVIYGVRTDPGGVFAFNTAKQTAKQLGGMTGEQALQSMLPLAGLLLEGRTLYGVTQIGGSFNVGTVFGLAK